ncbi:MAG: tetratricopeptide repeat protein [Gemmatimonadaceae bacterium]
MAQAPRINSSSAAISDDPLENATVWAQSNTKPILIGLAGAAVIALGIFGYRYFSAEKIEKSSTALYQAQGPLLEGKLPEAQTALQRVATQYSGTAAGQQANLLLAQVLYDQKQYQGGVDMLNKARGSASRENQASFDAMIASGYEGMGNLDKAAEAYGKAAASAINNQEREKHLLSQGRSLMLAGKTAEAKKIFDGLIVDNTSAVAQEARVRLGEIAGSSVK